MGNFLIFALLARMRKFRLRWGITATGLVMASGRGTFPAACAVGCWAWVSGVAPGPSGPTAGPMIVIGALAGAVYGLVPRNPRFGRFRRPTFLRVTLCSVAGGAAIAPLIAFGRMPVGAASPVGVVVLSGGLVGVLAYLIRQRSRARNPETNADLIRSSPWSPTAPPTPGGAEQVSGLDVDIRPGTSS